MDLVVGALKCLKYPNGGETMQLVKLVALLSFAGCSKSASVVEAPPSDPPRGGDAPRVSIDLGDAAADSNRTSGKSGFNRIVGGKEAKPGQWPFMVALARKRADGRLAQFCGGTMLASRSVLTAAHCSVRAGDVVIAGRADLGDSSGREILVQNVFAHTDYDASTYENDVAVLELAKPFEPLDANGKPTFVRIPADGTDVQGGTKVAAMGWGRVVEGGPASSVLRWVELTVDDRSSCDTAYGTGVVSQNMICASETDQDSCQGDSGGPLVHKDDGGYTQVGVVSFGRGCARDGYPGVYARLGRYRMFVDVSLKDIEG